MTSASQPYAVPPPLPARLESSCCIASLAKYSKVAAEVEVEVEECSPVDDDGEEDLALLKLLESPPRPLLDAISPPSTRSSRRFAEVALELGFPNTYFLNFSQKCSLKYSIAHSAAS